MHTRFLSPYTLSIRPTVGQNLVDELTQGAGNAEGREKEMGGEVSVGGGGERLRTAVVYTGCGERRKLCVFRHVCVAGAENDKVGEHSSPIVPAVCWEYDLVQVPSYTMSIVWGAPYGEGREVCVE